MVGYVTPVHDQPEDFESSAERFRLLAENAAEIIGVLDEEGRHIYVNPSYSKILGFQPSELIGRIGMKLAHPDD